MSTTKANVAIVEPKKFFAGLGLGVNRRDPKAAIKGALDLFESAQEKLTKAQQDIEAQIEEDNNEIERLKAQVETAESQVARAKRINERFANLLE